MSAGHYITYVKVSSGHYITYVKVSSSGHFELEDTIKCYILTLNDMTTFLVKVDKSQISNFGTHLQKIFGKAWFPLLIMVLPLLKAK